MRRKTAAKSDYLGECANIIGAGIALFTGRTNPGRAA
jgi:hypothetical protein